MHQSRLIWLVVARAGAWAPAPPTRRRLAACQAEAGLDTINREVQGWIRGETPMPARWVRSDTAPVWSRHYSDRPDAADCALLAQTLETLGAERMVVGHTVQDAPNPDCDGRVWRMDVGMAAHYGGNPAAIEIVGDSVTLME